ncbi:hypothetical protein [Microbacterium sp. W4I20]|uniref:hypothetical protein n=1 Tax=Microbacterium sp. W4I20 TaxID=3042262 RepID=UPI00278883C5|nr:hypothetical protein [Microbacterium sp. W4I20]MDQ0728586.1 hypothetical protein [Microbacterium sp. W4I20]
MTVLVGRASAVGGSLIARGVAAEWRRLRGDLLPWAFLPLALLSALSLAASLPPDLRAAPPAIIESLGAALATSLFGGLFMIAAVLGALGVALADKTGVLAREQLFTSPIVSFAARAGSSVVATAFFGAFGVAVVQVAFLALAGETLLTALEAASVVAATAGAGLWGYFVGILVRSPILVLFIVPATLMPALVLAEVVPDVAAALPLSALLAMSGMDADGLGLGAGTTATLAWLAALAAVVVVVLRRRDRL